MKRHLVLRYLRLFSIGFCLVSGFEFIGFIIFSFYIPINVAAQEYTIFSLFFISELSPIDMTILWILLFASIFILLIFAILMLRISKNDRIENITYSKILLSTGIFILIANFIKVEAIYVLAKNVIDPFGTPINFELLLYDPLKAPFFGAVLWIYFTASACVYFISGLVFAAIGLKWMLLLENKELT